MKTIVVDDEPIQLQAFRFGSENIPEIEVVGYFDSPLEALEYARQAPVELAFLDIRMPEMDGIALAEQLHMLNPQIKIVALTASDMEDGLASEHVEGVVLKPYIQEDLESALSPLIRNLE